LVLERAPEQALPSPGSSPPHPIPPYFTPSGALMSDEDALALRQAASAALDARADETAQQAERIARQQAVRLEAAERPVKLPIGGVVLEESGEHDVAPFELTHPHAQESQPLVAEHVQSGMTHAEAAETDVGDVTKLRLQAARLMVLEEEAVKLRSLLDERTEAMHALEKLIKEEQQQRAKLERSEKLLRTNLAKEKSRADGQQARAEGLERDLALLKKEADEANKNNKVASSEQKSKDVRLNRALEELERYRTQLRELREDREGVGQGARAEAQRLANENNRLRKRQSELLLAFRKQARLIDVLKRQKLHAEAAQMLSFTEEEFTRTLELGEALA